MSIQQDVLDTIGTQGVEVSALRGAMGNIGQNELDLVIRALTGAQRIRIVADRYEIIPSKRPLGVRPSHRAKSVDAPPSAAEEAAASLKPEPVRSVKKRTVNGESGELKRAGPFTEPPIQQLPDGAKPSPTFSAINGSGGEVPSPTCTTRLPTSPSAAAPSKTSVPAQRQRQRPGEATQTAEPEEAVQLSPLTPVIAHSVFERVKVQRQAALNKIALLKVDVANLELKVAECEQFIGLYEKFAAP